MKPLQERIRKLEIKRPKVIKVDIHYDAAMFFLIKIGEKEINELASRIEASKLTKDDIELIESIPKCNESPESLILMLSNFYHSI